MHYKTLKVVSSNLKKYFYKCLYFTGQVGAFGQKYVPKKKTQNGDEIIYKIFDQIKMFISNWCINQLASNWPQNTYNNQVYC